MFLASSGPAVRDDLSGAQQSVDRIDLGRVSEPLHHRGVVVAVVDDGPLRGSGDETASLQHESQGLGSTFLLRKSVELLVEGREEPMFEVGLHLVCPHGENILPYDLRQETPIERGPSCIVSCKGSEGIDGDANGTFRPRSSAVH